ncbi:hypothetical protein D3C84_533130 [compost metagenome]
MGAGKFRCADNHRGGATARRAGEVFAQPAKDRFRRQDFFDRQRGTKDGVFVIGRVLARFDAHLGQGLFGYAHLQHGVDLGAEHADRRRCIALFVAEAHEVGDNFRVSRQWADLVREDHVDRACGHLFESKRQGAFDLLPPDSLYRQGKRRGATGAVVVDVENRDAADVYPVERGLSCAAIPIDIAAKGLLDQRIVDAGILERRPCGLFTHDIVALRLTRFAERHHAYSGDNNIGTHSDSSINVMASIHIARRL